MADPFRFIGILKGSPSYNENLFNDTENYAINSYFANHPVTLYDLGVITPQGNSIIKTFVYDSKASMADNVHKALDIAGFIPGIGSFSEGANSLLYAFQGEKSEAALAALSAIPGIKAVKVLKDGIQYLKIIPESGEAGKALKELYDVEKTAGNTGHVIEVTAESSKANQIGDLGFATKAAEHMKNPGRFVPVQMLRDAIESTKAFPDPRGSLAEMHYTTMVKNGQTYNLEVLYDRATNTVYHFEYTRKAIGDLPAISK